MVHQCVRYLTRSTRPEWDGEKGPFGNSTATYSYGAIIVPEAAKDLLQTLGEQRDVDLLASETLSSANQGTDATLINIGQLLYFHLYAHNAPIISPDRRANIEAKLRACANDEKKITALSRCMPPTNFLPANSLLLYHLVKFLNTISWKAKSQRNGRKVLAPVFCGIIGLGEVETKLLIGSYQKILCPLYQDNDKNVFWLEEEHGKKTTSWSVRAMSSDDDYDAPSA